ncbi:lantibiotic ABC transporter permease [Streptococcus panodentis]|uniref:Lantibiotic ABC transporter permease n=1 Tax=Streptococcus panodentis TaxID=1581472 RepID=A0ABS5AX61_9STRE|nr:lantibiotic ABC transporter permease [Streptococcus panodentis]MBP2621163.1 lantibiotic ABC transporter permease [Streptococcus panodentis]
MFGKLFKYDFKSNYKWYCITFAIFLGLSVFMGLFAGSVLKPDQLNYFSDYPTSTAGFVIIFYLLFLMIFSAACAVFLSNTIIIIRRFYKNVFGREGYLTWTLPVTPHQILLSKLLSAFIWSLLCMLTMLVGGFLIFGIALPIVGYSLQELFKYLDYIPSFWLWLIKFGFINLLQTISGILFFYLVISIGQLFKKNRIMMAVLFGFLIWTVLAVFSLFLPTPYSVTNFLNLYDDSSSYDDFYLSFSQMLDISLIIRSIFELVKIFGFYFTVYAIVKNKLNLQ